MIASATDASECSVTRPERLPATFLVVAPLAQATAAFGALLETTAERVLWTDSTDEALQMAQEWRPDLALIDLTIASGGEDACRRLLAWRATAEDRFTPIGLVADEVTAAEAVRLVGSGADDVLWRDATHAETKLRLALLLRLAERYANLAHRAREAQAALRHERAMRRRAEALDALTAIILVEPAFDRIVQRLTHTIASALRADGGIVYDADMAGRSVVRLYSVGAEDLVRRVDGAPIERLALRLAQESRPRQLMLDAHDDGGEAWAVLAAAVPRQGGRLTLAVLWRRGETFFGAHELRLFGQMIERVTQTISHVPVSGAGTAS